MEDSLNLARQRPPTQDVAIVPCQPGALGWLETTKAVRETMMELRPLRLREIQQLCMGITREARDGEVWESRDMALILFFDSKE